MATLISPALGLSITVLMRWSYGSGDREAARQAQAEHNAYRAQMASGAPAYPQPQPAPPTQQGMPMMPPQPAPRRAGTPGQPPAQQLLPWPTYPDGRPLPIGPDGQPDFSVLNR